MVSRLKSVLRARHLQTHGAFCREYDRVAAALDPELVGSAPGRAQFHRWLSGELKGLPYPHHCRVLEAMLPGHAATDLFELEDPEQAGGEAVGNIRRGALSRLSGDAELSVFGRRAVRPLRQLPPDTHDFTGRDEQIVRLVARLAEGPDRAVPVAAVVGAAGTGKTALAVHVAHTLAEVYPDGQLYVNLRGAEPDPLTAAEVLAGFLRALGLDGTQIPEDTDERARLFRDLLAGCRVLVVLDNAADEIQLRPLLPGAVGCAVLITSRSPLAALSGSRTVHLDVLPTGQALALLTRVIGAERAEAEPDALADIARLCGCLPLALRIAGARLVSRPGWSVGWFAERLADESRRLDLLEAGDLAVRASFDLSYHSCGTDEQRAFRLLSLTSTTFPAWNIAALLDVDLTAAEELLETLVDTRLVETAGTDATGTVRYRLHDLMRDFARERSHTHDTLAERRDAAERLIECYLSAVHVASAALRPGLGVNIVDDTAGQMPANLAEEDPRAWFTAERANLPAAVELAHRLELWELAWRLAEALPPMFDWRADWQTWDHTHELALHAARNLGNDRAVAVIRRSLGALYRELGRYRDAADMLGEAAEIFHRLDDQPQWAATLRHLGDTCRYQGRLHDALTHFTAALDIVESAGDTRTAAGIHNGAADASRGLSRWEDARRHFETSLAIYRRLDDRLEQARTRVRYGLVHRDRWDNDRALAMFDEALVVFRELDDYRWQTRTLRHVAVVRRNDGDIDHAIDLFADCLARFDRLADRRGMAVTLRNRGDAHRLAEHYEEAVADLSAAYNIFESLADQRWMARTELSRADLDRQHQRWDGAIHRTKTALDAFAAIGDRHGEGRTLRQLGLIHRDAGDHEAATDALSTAGKIFTDLGDGLWLARVHAGHADVAERRGHDPAPHLAIVHASCRDHGLTGDRQQLVLKEW